MHLCVYFLPSPITGQISSVGRLDYETQTLYRFEVSASDGIFSCASKVLVGLLDENDNPPIFSAAVYNESVSENTTLNTLLTRVQAVDPDTGRPGRRLLLRKEGGMPPQQSIVQ